MNIRNVTLDSAGVTNYDNINYSIFRIVGAAGHVTPMFELAKAMKNHNITFVTNPLAQGYVDLNSYASSSFRIIYANDSSDAFLKETTHEQQLLLIVANHSITPPSFYTPSYSHPYKKYLGAFVDETPVDDTNDVLTTWIKSKPLNSILYGAFGSTSVILYDRMYNLINGLAMFLLQTDDSFLLLAFRSTNYDTYKTVLENLDNVEFREVLENEKRVRIENGYVQQKWILQQNSVKVFLSHCGMGSCLEALYFSKPILCMPFNMEQFSNAIMIENLGVGQSLFMPPSLLESLIHPYDFVKYTFTARSVTNKILALWMNITFEKAARLMSMEMKYAGGVKKAVEEIEFFVNLDGDLDRFAPFQDTLPFYQRYMLDLLLIFVILPDIIIIYIILKCCKRQRKMKTD
ncbi:unnamed protein product [Rotaria sp. Silwood1]|nr:unnamed protein product [Rotaria sp. Silwood1]